jgi:two-component system phosphate regulon sensor histidine kinase PhoR
MGPKNKLKLSRILLASAILLIVAFQSYWLGKLYREEWAGLKKDSNAILRDVVYDMQVKRYDNIQVTRIKNDSTANQKKPHGDLFAMNVVNDLRHKTDTFKKISSPAQGDSTDRDFEKKVLRLLNLPDSPYTSSRGSARIQIRGDALPPEIVQELNKRQVAKLPPMMDSALLRRMQSGMKVVVSFNRPHDSIGMNEKYMEPGAVGFMRTGSGSAPRFYVSNKTTASTGKMTVVKGGRLLPEAALVKMIIDDTRALDDSLSVPQLDSIYKRELTKAGIKLDFDIKKGKGDSLHWKDTLNSAKLVTSPRAVGLSQKYWYQAVFENPTGFLLKKISLQILFSLFLIAFTSVTFLFLYRNLVAQRKLTEMKNDFISNITHELKTPLATVSVAVEALRNFGGIQNPERTKEYLDISASELQRLSLLVDKVLKLSYSRTGNWN